MGMLPERFSAYDLEDEIKSPAGASPQLSEVEEDSPWKGIPSPRESIPAQMLKGVGSALTSFAGYLSIHKKQGSMTLSKRRTTFGKLRRAVKKSSWMSRRALTNSRDPAKDLEYDKQRSRCGGRRPSLRKVHMKPTSRVGRRPVELREVVVMLADNSAELERVSMRK